MRFVLPTPDLLRKAPFVGPKGGLWADPQHKIHWDPVKHGKTKPVFVAADMITSDKMGEVAARLAKLPLKALNQLLAELAKREEKIIAAGDPVPVSLSRWERVTRQAIKEAEARPAVRTKKPKKAKQPGPEQMGFVFTPPTAPAESVATTDPAAQAAPGPEAEPQPGDGGLAEDATTEETPEDEAAGPLGVGKLRQLREAGWTIERVEPKSGHRRDYAADGILPGGKAQLLWERGLKPVKKVSDPGWERMPEKEEEPKKPKRAKTPKVGTEAVHAAVRGLKGKSASKMSVSMDAAKVQARLDAMPQGSVVTWLDPSGYHDDTWVKVGPSRWTTYSGMDPQTKSTKSIAKDLVEQKSYRPTFSALETQPDKSKPVEKPKAVIPAKKKPKKPKEPKQVEGKIEQVGEHVWGSRKDLAALSAELREGKRDLTGEDLATMSYDDAAYLVTKKNLVPVWDLDTLKGFGMSPGAAHAALGVVAAIRAKPDDNAAAREQYRSDVRSLLAGLTETKTVEDVRRLVSEMGYAVRRHNPWERVEDIKITPTRHLDWETRDRVVAEDLKRDHARAKELTEQTGVHHQVISQYQRGTFIGKSIPAPYEQFGTKFKSLIKNQSKSKTWRTILQEARKADSAEDGWAWLQERGGAVTDKAVRDRRREALKAAGFSGETKRGWSEAKMWQSLRGDPVRREGHKVEIKDADPSRFRDTFNLGEVDYGKEAYMTQGDREYHTQQCEGACHDLSEILGIDPKTVSLNGRLSIAFGARGRGQAKAHYESNGKIINITKYRGGGSLAHEWGHAVDNIIAEHYIKGGTSKEGPLLSRMVTRKGIDPKVQTAMQKVLDAMEKHPDPARARREYRAYARKLGERIDNLVKQSNALVDKANEIVARPETQEELDRVVAAKEMILARTRKTTEDLKAQTRAQQKKGKVPSYRMENLANREAYERRQQAEIAQLKAGGLRTVEDNKRLDSLKLQVEGYRLEINRQKRYQSRVEGMDPTISDYSRSAGMLGKYYEDTAEKFARAFESYIQDSLRAKGRLSDYLTGGRKTETVYNTAAELPNGKNAQPYPQGEERKRINEAMAGFIDTLKTTGALYKALRDLYVMPLEKVVGA